MVGACCVAKEGRDEDDGRDCDRLVQFKHGPWGSLGVSAAEPARFPCRHTVGSIWKAQSMMIESD